MRSPRLRTEARPRPVARFRIASALALALSGTPCVASAWTDARPSGLVTELAVDRDGGATVTLRIRWRVLAGRFRSFELAELPTDFALLEATAADATGVAVPIATRIPGTGRLEVSLGEDGSGLRRGAIDVVLSFTTSLRAQGAIHRTGDDAVLDVTTVPWERGLEATEIRVALPSSVRRAQWLSDETPGVDATVTSELGRDVVHAVRRHLPAGARWTGRVACDPALFAWLDRPDAVPVVARRIDRRSLAPFAVFGSGLALLLGGAFATLSRLRRGPPRFVLPRALRSLPLLFVSTGGLVQALVLLRTPAAASLGTALALTGFALGVPRLATSMHPVRREASRLVPDERIRGLIARDRSSRRPLLYSAVTMSVAVALAVFATLRHSAPAAIVAIDAALVAMATAATLRTLRPTGDARRIADATRGLVRRLARTSHARLAFRMRGHGDGPGNTFARIVPRPGHRFARGLRAIEMAVAWRPGVLAWQGIVVLSIRIQRGTALEKPLRLLATRMGTLVASPDGHEMALSVDLVGPDRGAMAALERLLPTAIVAAPTTHASPTHAVEQAMNAMHTA